MPTNIKSVLFFINGQLEHIKINEVIITILKVNGLISTHIIIRLKSCLHRCNRN